MTQAVAVPGVGTVQFPDGMAPDAMAAAIQQNFPHLAPGASASATQPPAGGVLHDIGMGARAADQGVVSALTAVPDAVTTGLINPALRLANRYLGTNLPQQATLGGDFSRALDALGTAKPTTPGQQIASNIIGDASGAVAGAGLLGALGGAASTLSSAPNLVRAALSGAAGGAGAQAARAMGAGPTGQTIAGALGSLGPGISEAPLAAFLAREPASTLTGAEQQALAGGRSVGMQATPGQIAGSKPMQQFEARLGSQPETSGPLTAVAANNQTALNRTAAQAIGEKSDTVDSSVLSRANDRLGNVFENVRSSERDVPTSPRRTGAALDSIDQAFSGLLPNNESIRGNPLVKQLTDLVGNAAPKTTGVKSFMEDVGTASPRRIALPSGVTAPTERLLDGVRVDLAPDPTSPDTVHVSSLEALRPGEGSGTAALKKLTDLADQHGVRLTLDAVPMGESGMEPGDLMRWYQSHGFHVAADDGLMPLMERAPAAQMVSAEQLGNLSSKLGKAAYKQMTTPSGDRELGRALFMVKEHTDDLVQSALSPEDAAEYGKARKQYRNLMMLTARPNLLNPSTGNVNGPALAAHLQRTDRPGFLYRGPLSIVLLGVD